MSDLRPFPYDRKEIAFRENNTENYAVLMNSFLNLEDDHEFVSKLKIYQQEEWVRGPDDIFVWIPVLNRLNCIFKKIAEKHHLNINIPTLKRENENTSSSRTNSNTSNNIFVSNASENTFDSDEVDNVCFSTKSIDDSDVEDEMKISYDAFLTQLPRDTETFILDMTNFILFLLENTFGGSVDSSVDGILPLLNVPNMEIKLRCMKVLSIISLRNFQTYSYNKLLQKDIIKKSSIIASSLLCSTPTDTKEAKSFDLFEFLTKLTSKPLDILDDNELVIPENSFLPFSFEYYSEKNDCSEIFKLEKETIINSSYD